VCDAAARPSKAAVTPVMASGCYGARRRRQATRAGSSPPGADLRWLHDDETAAIARNQRPQRVRVFVAAVQDGGVAARARVRSPGGGATLNSPRSRLGGQRRVREAAAGHGRSGMTAGPQLSSTAGEGGGGAGWRRRCGLAGPLR
jgi:hypothetical protein